MHRLMWCVGKAWADGKEEPHTAVPMHRPSSHEHQKDIKGSYRHRLYVGVRIRDLIRSMFRSGGGGEYKY